MSDKKRLPNFVDETEEARWYADHRDELDDYFEVVEGGKPELDAILSKNPRGPGRPPAAEPSRHVQLRMPVAVVDRIKILAAIKGVRYQTLMKAWLVRATDEEEQ